MKHEPFDIGVLEVDLANGRPPQGSYNPKGYPLVVKGDLHGNALYLIDFLLGLGVFRIQDELAYETLRKIYNSTFVDDLTHDDWNTYQIILSQFEVAPSAVSSIIFLGDDLADRGGHDALTLAVYYMLAVHGVNFIIIASNHWFKFHQVLLNSSYPPIPKEYESFYRSWLALKRSMDQGVVCSRLVKKMYQVYLRHMSLVQLVPLTGGPHRGKSVVFSHAPLQLLLLKKVFEEYGVPFCENLKEVPKLNRRVRNKLLGEAQNWACRGDDPSLCLLIEARDKTDFQMTREMLRNVHGHTGSDRYFGDNRVSIDGSTGRKGYDVGQAKIFLQKTRGQRKLGSRFSRKSGTQMLEAINKLNADQAKMQQAALECAKHIKRTNRHPTTREEIEAIAHGNGLFSAYEGARKGGAGSPFCIMSLDITP